MSLQLYRNHDCEESEERPRSVPKHTNVCYQRIRTMKKNKKILLTVGTNPWHSSCWSLLERYWCVPNQRLHQSRRWFVFFHMLQTHSWDQSVTSRLRISARTISMCSQPEITSKSALSRISITCYRSIVGTLPENRKAIPIQFSWSIY